MASDVLLLERSKPKLEARSFKVPSSCKPEISGAIDVLEVYVRGTLIIIKDDNIIANGNIII